MKKMPTTSVMMPVLIHIHVYYHHLWAELRDGVRRVEELGGGYRLVVTMVEPHPEMEAVQSFFPGAEVRVVPNRGYDIAPFLEVLQSVNLDDYSYVVKLHTKRDMPGDVYLKPMPYNYGGSRWREYLLNFCRREHLPRIMQRFALEPDLGMVADYRLIRRTKEARFVAPLDDLLTRSGLQNKGYQYVMGSMFICRACLLAPLKTLGFGTDDFPAADEAHAENLAHVLERFLGLAVVAQGYRIADVFSGRWEQSSLRRQLLQIWSFIYSAKRKSNGGIIVKILKVPVYASKK